MRQRHRRVPNCARRGKVRQRHYNGREIGATTGPLLGMLAA